MNKPLNILIIDVKTYWLLPHGTLKFPPFPRLEEFRSSWLPFLLNCDFCDSHVSIVPEKYQKLQNKAIHLIFFSFYAIVFWLYPCNLFDFLLYYFICHIQKQRHRNRDNVHVDQDVNPHLPHHASPVSGMYKGKTVVDVEKRTTRRIRRVKKAS